MELNMEEVVVVDFFSFLRVVGCCCLRLEVVVCWRAVGEGKEPLDDSSEARLVDLDLMSSGESTKSISCGVDVELLVLVGGVAAGASSSSRPSSKKR